MSPSDALQEFSHIQYDLAIVDTGMRSLPSEDFLAHLRLVDPGLPLVILTEPGDDNIGRFHPDDRTTILVKDAGYYRLLPDLARKRPRSGDSFGGHSDDALAGVDHDVDAIVANLENDINNPLMAILGAVELITSQADRVPEDIVRKVDIIRTSAQRIQDVLSAFSSTLRVK